MTMWYMCFVYKPPINQYVNDTSYATCMLAVKRFTWVMVGTEWEKYGGFVVEVYIVKALYNHFGVNDESVVYIIYTEDVFLLIPILTLTEGCLVIPQQAFQSGLKWHE